MDMRKFFPTRSQRVSQSEMTPDSDSSSEQPSGRSMEAPAGPATQPDNLVIPIYLNQDLTFSLLAQLEDGFSTLSNVTTSVSESNRQDVTTSGKLGVSNVFALLETSFAREKKHGTDLQTTKGLTEERVHTPASLFSRLRIQLLNLGILTQIRDDLTFETISNGMFIEFHSELERSPLLTTLEWMKRMMTMAQSLDTSGDGRIGAPTSDKRRGAKNKSDETKQMEFLQTILDDLSEGGRLDIVGSLVDVSNGTAVFSTKQEYFTSQDTTSILDGEYRVLGRVTRVISQESDEEIDLLRKTSFSHLTIGQVDDLFTALREGMTEQFDLPKLYTKVGGPALQIVPVAVYS